MAKDYKIFIWKKAPFLRLLLPVITGIVAGFYLEININIIAAVAAGLILAFFIFNLLPLAYRFKLQALNGIIITAFIINAVFFLHGIKMFATIKTGMVKNMTQVPILLQR